jgi:hypothetical protein
VASHVTVHVASPVVSIRGVGDGSTLTGAAEGPPTTEESDRRSAGGTTIRASTTRIAAPTAGDRTA